MKSNGESSAPTVPDPHGPPAPEDASAHPEQPLVPMAMPRQVVVQKRIAVQGRPAAYSVAGSGMPVVFLHGWGLADHGYRSVISAVASLIQA